MLWRESQEMELYCMQALKERIQKLKKERDAVILAHFYVDGSVQEIADYVGDSYYLSKKASERIVLRYISHARLLSFVDKCFLIHSGIFLMTSDG